MTNDVRLTSKGGLDNLKVKCPKLVKLYPMSEKPKFNSLDILLYYLKQLLNI